MSAANIVSLFHSSTEVWKAIPGTNGSYSASNLGRIRSEPLGRKSIGKQRGRILSPIKNRKGYRWFRAFVPNGSKTMLTVHKAVAITFIGPKPKGLQVNHKDGDKENNRPENLEYVSCRENIRHCWANGMHGSEHCRGSKNPRSRLTQSNVLGIRQLHPAMSLAELAKRFGVTKQAVWHIVHRKTWKHV